MYSSGLCHGSSGPLELPKNSSPLAKHSGRWQEQLAVPAGAPPPLSLHPQQRQTQREASKQVLEKHNGPLPRKGPV